MYTGRQLEPDYIVGITRGGNVPVTIISNMTSIRYEALKVSLRDDPVKVKVMLGWLKTHLIIKIFQLLMT